MTGAPVTDVTGFSFQLSAGRLNGSSEKNMGEGFADVLNGRGDQLEAFADTKDKKLVSGEQHKVEKLENLQQGSRKKTPSIVEKNTQKLTEQEAGKIEEVSEEMLFEIAEALDVTVEEVQAAMETLGLTVTQLIEPGNLAKLAVELVEEVDSLTLVTDEQLFTELKELSEELVQNVEQLAEELGIEPEKLMDKMEEALQAREPEERFSFVQEKKEAKEIEVEVIGTKVQSQEADMEKPVFKENKETTGLVKEEVSIGSKELSIQPEKESSLESRSEEENSGNGEQKAGSGLFQPQNILTEGKATAVKMEIPIPTLDGESILNQIGEAVQIRNGENFTSMELQLHPESLGTLHLQIKAKEGMITAQITTENEAVKQVLETQVVQLKEKLEAQGVKVEAVEVSVASHEFERNLEKGNSQEKDSYEAKKVTRRKLQLNLPDEEEPDLEEEEKAAREIQKDMMRKNGNILDYMA